jgi:beta-carotene ketolase (CrtO type)
MAPADCDVIVVGAGHNGLVCGAYLARAGKRVLVLERAAAPGGCVAAAEIPGFPEVVVDIGGLEQGAIAGSPVIQELRLAEYGLRYLRHERVFSFPFADGTSWLIDTDMEQTVASIARISAHDAAAFPRFAGFSRAVLSLLGAISEQPPLTVAELAQLAGLTGRSGAQILASFLSSPRQVVDAWFDSEQVRAGLLNYASHAQTPPWQLGSGYAPCLALGGQAHGGMRPVGGGRRLIQALQLCIERHGGMVRCDAGVARIVVADRRATGVVLDSGEQILARDAVVASIDARRVFTGLVPPEHVPASLLRAAARLTSARHNIGELSMACVLSEAPAFRDPGLGESALLGGFWQSGDVQDLEDAFTSIRLGALPTRQPLMWAIPSALDPTLAPAGRQVLWLAAFVPFALREGGSWDEQRDRVADHLLATLGDVAPNLPGSVLGRQVLTPLDWQRRTGNLSGNADHLDTSLDQMLGSRPLPALSGYRTPLRGLYLTGAGTHPGGGITGRPGRNTARVVLRDLGLLATPPLQRLAEKARRLGALAEAVRALQRLI